MTYKEPITVDRHREIIDDFAKVIEERKDEAPSPKEWVIRFRQESKNKKARTVYLVPLEILRYRKNNGRIASEVISYEKKNGHLDEKKAETQEIIKNFLDISDPESNQELINSIRNNEQTDPAIITADGFLINGNRRKLAFEKLLKEAGSKEELFNYMKVVILPGKDDKGGPPTLEEIRQIERRYQQHSDGKSEYSRFNKAISDKKDIEKGMDLEKLLKDDPMYAHLPDKELKKKAKEYKKEVLLPLDCVDRYLEALKRPDLYSTISKGVADKKGRYEAFIDYAALFNTLKDDRKRQKMGISEDEVGQIEQAAFTLIRQREFPGTKVHNVIREIKKWITNKESKKEILKLSSIKHDLSEEECYDKESGQEYDENRKDEIWIKKHKTEIIKRFQKAKKHYEDKTDKEAPLILLEDALKKLEDDEMAPESVGLSNISYAMKLSRKIQKVAEILEDDFYRISKKPEKLQKKYSGKKH